MSETPEQCANDTANVIKAVLSPYALELGRCGSKKATLADTRPVDNVTGFWANANDATNKPLRWLLHLSLDRDQNLIAFVPPQHGSDRVGFFNTANRQVGAGTIRIVPALRVAGDRFQFMEQWESLLLFCFPSALERGSAAQLMEGFDAATGAVTYKGTPQPYIFAGLIGIQSDENPFTLAGSSITYSQVLEAIQKLIHVSPNSAPPTPVPLYEGCSYEGRKQLADDVEAAYRDNAFAVEVIEVGADDDADQVLTEDTDAPAIKPPDRLIGIDDSVFRQINGAIRSGKRHLMLYGPPGTGKTTLAEHIAGSLSDQYTLITGSADWTSQDVIGGYQPLGDGKIGFVPGILLKRFDQPLIIDELNRCDIDKVIGPLFTVLSNQRTELPYRVEVESADSPVYAILPKWKPDRPQYEYSPTGDWRIIATINSIDKASLYQMSYALTRRFAWIYLGIPADLRQFLLEWMLDQEIIDKEACDSAPETFPLTDLWSSVSTVRAMGPAPFLDVIRYIRSQKNEFDFLSSSPSLDDAGLYVDGLSLALVPMLDGIRAGEAETIAKKWIAALALAEADALAGQIKLLITDRAF